MNRKQKILILLIVLIVLTAVASVMLAILKRDLDFPFIIRQYRPNPADIELYYIARTVFSTINIVLTLVLIANYVSIYLKTKSNLLLV